MQDVPEMTPAMATAVVGFLRGSLTLQRELDTSLACWFHDLRPAYQVACMALVALGEAEATEWGARPKADPFLPEVLPFWEDLAAAVLWLARQQGKIEYLWGTGRTHADLVVKSLSGRTEWSKSAKRQTTGPNIFPRPGTGPAFAEADVVALLESLGLVAAKHWTSEAEAVHWRRLPLEWGLKFEADARFLAAVDDAVLTLPRARQEEMDRLMRIAGAEVAEGVARSAAAVGDARARLGPDAIIAGPMTAELMRELLLGLRKDKLDAIFFRRWRLGRGWLDDEQVGQALEISHDWLAVAMRQAVVARLYPGGFVWD